MLRQSHGGLQYAIAISPAADNPDLERALIKLEKTNKMAPCVETTAGAGRAARRQMRRRIKVGSPSLGALRHTCQGGSCQDIKARGLFRLPISSSAPKLLLYLT